MKKILLSACALVIATATFAQQANHLKNDNLTKNYSTLSTTPNVMPSSASAAPPPIWSDDFSNPANWIIAHDPTACDLDWLIGVNSCQGSYPINDILSTSAANGWAMIDSDFYGGATGGTEIEDCWLTMANPVDLNGLPNVRLEFETNYRSFNDEQTYIVVGIGDGSGNVTWPDLDPTTNISTMTNVFKPFVFTGNTATANPALVTIDISPALVGLTPTQLADIYIRFHWTGTWGYAWFVDDVAIALTPDNELLSSNETIGGWWINYQTVGGLGQDYTSYPLAQATANPYAFESVLRNSGIATQEATMHAKVSGTSNWSTTSNPLTLAAGTQDTVQGINKFTPTATGLYNIEMWAVADSAGLGNVITYTDTTTKMTMVTNYIYGKDNGTNDGGSWGLNRVSPTPGGFEVSSNYDIYANATLYSVEARISDWSIPGAEVYAVLYEDDIAGGDPILLAQSDDYVITQSDLGAWVNIPFLTPQSLTSVTKTYRIAIGANLHPTDTVGVDVSDPGNYYSSQGLFDSDAILASSTAGPRWYTINDIPMLRMNFDPSSATAVSDFKQTIFNVYPNPTNGVFVIELEKTAKYDVRLYNVLGQTVYTTSTNAMSTTVDLSSFDKGIYTVELKDANTIYTEKVIVE